MVQAERRIDELDDAELLAGSLDRSTGRGAAWGCFAVFFACLAAAVVLRGSAKIWSALGSAVCPAALIAFLVMAAWFGVISGLHRARSAPYLREFLRGQGVTNAVEGDRAEGGGGERFFVVVSGRGLPHGGSRVVWVALSRVADEEGVLLHAGTPGTYGRGEVGAGEAALAPEWIESILVGIDSAVSTVATPKLATVRDGFPFTVAVHSSGSATPRVFEGNLCAGNWREHAGARLADVVLRAAEAVGAQRQPFGACSSDGDVTLGER